MADFNAEAFVILLAQSGSQTAVAAAMQCSQAEVSRKLKSARELLGDNRALELIRQYQRDEASGVTLRKPFIMGTGTCGVCGGAKTAQPSGKLRCNHCRNARYREAHPKAAVEVSTPEEDAINFLVLLAKEGTQGAAARALGVSQTVVSTRLSKARKLLGDARAIEVLKQHQCNEKCGHTLIKSFFLNSAVCQKCGEQRTPLATTGELVCRSCSNRRNQHYKRRHAARVAEANADYRERNREAIRQKHREYRAAHPEVYAAYYEANSERIKAAVSAYREANKGKIADYFRTRGQIDPAFRQSCRARLRAWKKRHPDRVNADTARRQLRLRQAYVPWANDELIAEAYDLAQLRTRMTGIPWQVDHIVPVNSDLVCGLHWESNLQVIPAVTNLAKSNDWWPDMPDAPAAHLAAFHAQPSLYLSLTGMVRRNAGKSERALQ
ncbi:helix-turn-helix domain-containing protein [Burkholderia ubonensis]|uniref:helix-turn-helix domain-containing protein n=1 Tax=Burkholderia ubonensis TaxID=101571 RepID=UPI000B007B85|nr:LysR family transcriptional regulator [Burkholderia ubonensis]